MYCVKCGVELRDQEETCPLCQTPVFHPERVVLAELTEEQKQKARSETLYSDRIARSSIRINRIKYTRTTGFVIIVLAFLCLIANLSISGNLFWAKFSLISLGELWACMVLPVKYAKTVRVGKIALALTLITCGYLLLLDLFLGFSMWSVFACVGLILLWFYGGFPFSMKYPYRRRMSFHLTFCLVISAIALAVFDILTGKTGFSLYTSFGLACVWCYVFLPLLLKIRFKVYIILAVDYLITFFFCWIILLNNGKSEVALTFALGVISVLFASGFLTLTICQLTKFSIFGIVGLSFLFTAVFIVILNLLINSCFFGTSGIDLYSIVCTACLVPISAFLIVFEKSPRLKEYLSKKLFI